MAKNEFIKHCRYYRGQKENPNTDDSNMAWFWDMERVYIGSNGKFDGERDVYKAIHGKEYPGIPFDLLMVMFTSWGKMTYDIQKSIGDFYKLIDEYLFIPNDRFPENEIPNRM